MNVIDSSAWLEYLADGPGASFFAEAIEAPDLQIVPTLTLYEVFKRILQQRGEHPALQAIALMQQGQVVDLDASLALRAASVSHEERLSMADAIILSTAREHAALLWTQDAHFEGLPDVRYRKRTP